MKLRMHWGVAVAVFYTAFALSTVGFVAFAMTRDVELVSDDYYQQALAHDRHMQAVANGDALGAALGATRLPDEVRSACPPRWCRDAGDGDALPRFGLARRRTWRSPRRRRHDRDTHGGPGVGQVATAGPVVR